MLGISIMFPSPAVQSQNLSLNRAVSDGQPLQLDWICGWKTCRPSEKTKKRTTVGNVWFGWSGNECVWASIWSHVCSRQIYWVLSRSTIPLPELLNVGRICWATTEPPLEFVESLSELLSRCQNCWVVVRIVFATWLVESLLGCLLYTSPSPRD